MKKYRTHIVLTKDDFYEIQGKTTTRENVSIYNFLSSSFRLDDACRAETVLYNEGTYTKYLKNRNRSIKLEI
jgi:hypothetical protein